MRWGRGDRKNKNQKEMTRNIARIRTRHRSWGGREGIPEASARGLDRPLILKRREISKQRIRRQTAGIKWALTWNSGSWSKRAEAKSLKRPFITLLSLSAEE